MPGSKQTNKQTRFLDLRLIQLVLTERIEYVGDEDEFAWVELNNARVRKKL